MKHVTCLVCAGIEEAPNDATCEEAYASGWLLGLLFVPDDADSLCPRHLAAMRRCAEVLANRLATSTEKGANRARN